MTVKEQVAIAIKHFREGQDLDLSDLAYRTTLPVEKLNEIENGGRWPTDSELDLILLALNLTLFELICSSKIGQSLTSKLVRLTKEKFTIVEAAIDGLLRSQKD